MAADSSCLPSVGDFRVVRSRRSERSWNAAYKARILGTLAPYISTDASHAANSGALRFAPVRSTTATCATSSGWGEVWPALLRNPPNEFFIIALRQVCKPVGLLSRFSTPAES